MVYPNSDNFNDKVESSNTVNPCPLGGESMVDPNTNKLICQLRTNEQITFLPTNDDLLSQLSDMSTNMRSDASTNKPADAATNKSADASTNKSADASTNRPADVPNNKPADAQTKQPSERPAQQFPHSEQNNQRIGALEYGLNEKGEPISITGPRGEYFYKLADGNWAEHMPPDKERVVENLNVDKDGNMEFDVVGDGKKSHHTRKVDGSHSVDSPEYGGLLVYDKDGNLIQAPAGEGHVRKFHYTNGQLDQIDGRLGHWDREVKDGQVSWVNKATGARWEGEMQVNVKSNALEFRGRNGIAWNFTTDGQDVYANPTVNATAGAGMGAGARATANSK